MIVRVDGEGIVESAITILHAAERMVIIANAIERCQQEIEIAVTDVAADIIPGDDAIGAE